MTTTTDKDALIELAERCEAATGPRWNLDEAIAQALGWDCRKETGLGLNGRAPGRTVWRRPDGVKARLPKFTASLDAAMTLVPEGFQWTIEPNSAWVRWLTADDVDEAQGQGACPALALCAAALRSRTLSKGDAE